MSFEKIIVNFGNNASVEPQCRTVTLQNNITALRYTEQKRFKPIKLFSNLLICLLMFFSKFSIHVEIFIDIKVERKVKLELSIKLQLFLSNC